MISQIKRLLLSSTSKDAFTILVGNGLVAIGGMLFSVLTARSLGPANFGIFSALFALVTLFGSLADMGISSALINFLPKLPSERNSIISATFWLQLLIGILLLFVTLSLIPLKHIILPGATTTHLLLLSLLVLTMSFESFAQAIFKAEKKFLHVSFLMGLGSWMKLGLTAVLFFYTAINIDRILLASLLASASVVFFGLREEFKFISRFFPKTHAKQVFQFAKWLAVMQIFSVAIARVDIILLNALHSSLEAGLFAAAGRVSLLFSLLVSSLGSVVAPRFSIFSEKSATISYLKKLSLLVLGVSGLMIFSIFLAPLIINLVFGPEYKAAIPVFSTLTLAMIPFLFSIITVNPIIYTYNQPSFIAKTTIIQVVVLVILDVLLIPKYGAFAPTISLAVANTLVLSITGYKLKTLLK